MKIHYPKLCNMTHALSLNAFIAFKGTILAHLSRRLIGELIVYKGIRRPSVRRPSSVNIFKRYLL